MKFKVGDRVEYVGECDPWKSWSPGTIVEGGVRLDNCPYYRSDGDCHDTAPLEEFVIKTQESSPVKFKVGDKVVCRHPVVVCDDFTDVVGVVVGTSALPAWDTGEQIITINYGDCGQTAYVDIDGVEYAEQQKTPDTEASEVTEGCDLSDHFDDQVNSPSHYGQGSIEAIEYIKDFLTKEEYIGYLRGNIAKYLHRWRFKGKPTEDLLKAQWYLNQLIDTVGGD